MDILEYNREAWNHQVEKKDRWTVPVSKEEIDLARTGQWSVVLTPCKPVPREWFPESMQGLKILCLASGGGQQGPVFSALGAEVTVYDNSPSQLNQDIRTAEAYGLKISTIQGDMRDLSVLTDGYFDLVFNPCSLCFIDNVLTVWKECHRVLKKGGSLLTGFINPVYLQLDEDLIDKQKYEIIHKQPYSDLTSINDSKRNKLIEEKAPLVFGHSLTDLIGGQLKAGFRISDMYEDYWAGERQHLDQYLPSFISTKAEKP